METEQQAEDMLEYCITYLTNKSGNEVKEFRKTELYNEMLKEIEFMIDTS